jgi:hypothetical protein
MEIEYVACLERTFSRLTHSTEQLAIQESIDTMRRTSAVVAVHLLRNSGYLDEIAALDEYVKSSDASSTLWKLSDRLKLAESFNKAAAPFDE